MFNGISSFRYQCKQFQLRVRTKATRKCRNLEDVVSGKDATGVAVVLVLANGALHLLLDRQKFLILGTQFDEHRTRRLSLQRRRRGQTGAAGRRRRGRR